MFKDLSEKDQVNFKKVVSRWLREYVIEPTLRISKPEHYLKEYDRKKAAESCYEYVMLTKEMNHVPMQVEKKKLVKDIAAYIDLRTPFIYNRKRFGTPDCQIDRQIFERIPFKYLPNNRNALILINETQKRVVLNNKDKWASEKLSDKQAKLIVNKLKEKKLRLRISIEEFNKYQAAVFIPYLLENLVYDREELQYLLHKAI